MDAFANSVMSGMNFNSTQEINIELNKIPIVVDNLSSVEYELDKVEMIIDPKMVLFEDFAPSSGLSTIKFKESYHTYLNSLNDPSTLKRKPSDSNARNSFAAHMAVQPQILSDNMSVITKQAQEKGNLE